MADDGLKIFGGAAIALLGACGGAAEPPSVPLSSASAPPPAPAPASFPDEPKLARFYSKRFRMHVPFPDGRAWKIDDHSHPELVATHAATRSKLTVAVFKADEPMSRQKCEAMARDKKLVPDAPMNAVEDTVTVGPESYDTRVLVAVAPPAGPGAPLVGHVYAFGGVLRSCFFFDFSSEVASAADEDALSARLAVARTRVLDAITIDPFGTVPEEKLDVLP